MAVIIVKTRSSQAVKRLWICNRRLPARTGCAETELPIEQVTVGDVVRVRPGERIAGDGTVVSGHSGDRPNRCDGHSVLSKKLKAILSSAVRSTAPARSS